MRGRPEEISEEISDMCTEIRAKGLILPRNSLTFAERESLINPHLILRSSLDLMKSDSFVNYAQRRRVVLLCGDYFNEQ